MLHKKDILEFIKRYDDTFVVKDNIYYAEKAFKTNSVINYLGELKDNDVLDYEEAEQIFELLVRYLRGEADVIWDKDRVMFRMLKGESANAEAEEN